LFCWINLKFILLFHEPIYSQEQELPPSKLLQRGSKIPETLLSGAPFPRRYGEAAPEDFSFCRDAHFPKKTGFPAWSAVMKLLSGKSFSWEKSRTKAHLDRRYLKKIYMKTILKLKINRSEIL
jgi:hypothetical protein